MSRTSVRLTVLFGTLTALLLSGATATNAQRPANAETEQVNGNDAVAREVLVKFRSAPQANTLNAIQSLADAALIEPVGRTGVRRIRSRSFNATALLRMLANRPDVLYAEPNYIVHAFTEPNDPAFPQLWGLRNTGQAVNGSLPGVAGADIRAAQAWDVSVGSTAQVVAVVDTGIDYTHPDLAANMWSAPAPFVVTLGGVPIACPAGTHGFNAITLTCNPMDDHHHGTHVSGTIGALGNNGVGVAGVNWITQLMGIKFLDANGSGSEADAINGIEFAIQVKEAFAGTGAANVRVLSNSWGGTAFTQALLDEINAANDADMLFVAAAGNTGFDNDIYPIYPASYDAPNIMSVAATTNTDEIASFSSYGANSVHLGAPGVDVLSTVPGNSYAFLSGTSMATPHVSGAAALVLSQCAFNTAALKDTLLSTVEPVPSLASITITGGRLDVNSAIRSCIAPPAPPAALTALAGDGQVTLQWSGAAGATSFNVKRSLTSGGPYTLLASGVKGKAYSDTAVVNGTTYYYVVSASNALGTSADSAEAAATPKVASDLVVSTMTVPATSGAGSNVAISETTKNQGPGTSNPSTTRFYLSRGSSIDASAVLLDVAHAVPPLSPGATSTATLLADIPADVAVGSYFIIAKADADNVENETSESNNTLARSLTIGPDLVLSSFTAPSTAAPGSSILAADTVKNQGGGAAGAFTTRFYISIDTVIDGSDVLAGSRSVPSLAAGGISSGSTTLLIPSTLTTGNYYLIAKADADDVVSETQESNNASMNTLRVGGDLVVSSLTVPFKIGAGSTIVVSDTTKNQGTGTVDASVTRFYLSTRILLDSSAMTLTDSRTVPPLAAGASSSASTTLLIPSTVATGSYYLIAKADADNVVPETQESNNTSVRAVIVGGDLVVSALTAPSTAGAGSTIVVSDTTANQGAGAVAASTTRFYLSSNTSLDTSDIVLAGARSVPALAGGGTSAGSVSLTIPSAVLAGTYYVIAKADADDAVVETQETNNTALSSIQVGGDLVVSALTVPAASDAGATIVVGDTTKNQGAGPVAASVTRFYLSSNTQLDASDTLLPGSHAVPELAAGASSIGSTSLTLPATLTTGTYYIIAKADADGTVAETQEANNTASASTQIGGDLVVSSLTVPATSGAGATIVVSDTTKNQGAGAVAASVTRFYLSSNSLLDVSDTLLPGSRSVPNLAAGASSSGSTTLVLPSTLTTGNYYVIAKADADNAVVESQEANNTFARSIAVGPDLTTASLSVTFTIAAGSTVSVTDAVQNKGGGDAGPSTTRFYLSSDLFLDAGDAELASGRTVPALAAGATSSGSTVITIPADTASGYHYLFAVADADRVVGESQENNNTAARAIQVTAGP